MSLAWIHNDVAGLSTVEKETTILLDMSHQKGFDDGHGINTQRSAKHRMLQSNGVIMIEARNNTLVAFEPLLKPQDNVKSLDSS